MSGVRFVLEHRQRNALGRVGRLATAHGEIRTPALIVRDDAYFLNGVLPAELRELRAPGLAVDALQLYLNPGEKRLSKLGGAHHFLAWDGVILSESGARFLGALSKTAPPDEYGRTDWNRGRKRRGQPARLIRVDDDGFLFTSPVDGSRFRYGPEEAIRMQEAMGADIMLCLDQPAIDPYDDAAACESAERTVRWAEQSLSIRRGEGGLLFGAVQDRASPQTCAESWRAISSLDLDGFSIRYAFSIEDTMSSEALTAGLQLLPDDRLRHLSGSFGPRAVVEGFLRGIDLIDSDQPTRQARAGRLFTRGGMLDLSAEMFREDGAALDSLCGCYACSRFSRGYLRHLLQVDELLGYTLSTLHNLAFFLDLASALRDSLAADAAAAFEREWLQAYPADDPDPSDNGLSTRSCS